MTNVQSERTLENLCWALSNISDGDDTCVEALISVQGLVENLVSLLCHECEGVVISSLRVLGNFTCRNDVQTQAVLDAGVLAYVSQLLNHPEKNVRKLMCWLLSNVAAGADHQISRLLRHRRDISLVIDIVKQSSFDVRKQAVWIIINITNGSDDHVHSLVNLGAIEALCTVLWDINDGGNINFDVSTTRSILNGMANILRVGKDVGKNYDDMVTVFGGLDVLESMQDHDDHCIREQLNDIFGMYFGGEDEVEDEEYHEDIYSIDQ